MILRSSLEKKQATDYWSNVEPILDVAIAQNWDGSASRFCLARYPQLEEFDHVSIAKIAADKYSQGNNFAVTWYADYIDQIWLNFK